MLLFKSRYGVELFDNKFIVMVFDAFTFTKFVILMAKLDLKHYKFFLNEVYPLVPPHTIGESTLADARRTPRPPKGPDSFVLTYKIFERSRLGSPRPSPARSTPPYGKSWIRHCILWLKIAKWNCMSVYWVFQMPMCCMCVCVNMCAFIHKYVEDFMQTQQSSNHHMRLCHSSF